MSTIWWTDGGVAPREPVPARAGRAARVDYEYRRMGTANLFVAPSTIIAAGARSG